MANIDKIKQLAREKGLKIKFICQQLGLSETYLSNVKNGIDRMTDERLIKIAALLQTSTDYLNDKTDNPAPPSENSPRNAVYIYDENGVATVLSVTPEQMELFLRLAKEFDR